MTFANAGLADDNKIGLAPDEITACEFLDLQAAPSSAASVKPNSMSAMRVRSIDAIHF
jgi:hypothetical protein